VDIKTLKTVDIDGGYLRGGRWRSEQWRSGLRSWVEQPHNFIVATRNSLN